MNPEPHADPLASIPATLSSATSTACTPTTLAEVMQRIRGEEFAARIAAIRAALGTEAAQSLKKALPAFLHGRFSRRNDTGLSQPAGVVGLDLDDIGADAVEQLRGQLAADPRCAYYFRSPSGAGAKIGIAVDPNRSHAESWNAARSYFEAKYGYAVDPACKNVSRLVFVSHDPAAHAATAPLVRVDYPVATEAPEPPAKTDSTPFTVADVRELLRYVPSKPDYDTWIRVISAVGSTLSEEEAISVLMEWSAEDHPGEYAAKWAHRLDNVSAGTLVYLAQKNGWKPSPSFKVPIDDALVEAEEMSALLDMLALREFGVGPAPVKPSPRLLVNGVTIATPGNLISITAQAKSGKTAVIGAIIASIIVADQTLPGVEQAGQHS